MAAAVYIWVGLATTLVSPSPKFHTKPVASILHEELKTMFCPIAPVAGTVQHAINPIELFLQFANVMIASITMHEVLRNDFIFVV